MEDAEEGEGALTLQEVCNMNLATIVFRLAVTTLCVGVGLEMGRRGEWTAFSICFLCLVLMGVEIQLRRIGDKMK